jgi:peptide/nickel transport system permease protein
MSTAVTDERALDAVDLFPRRRSRLGMTSPILGNPLGVFASGIILIVLVAGIFGSWIRPYDPLTVDTANNLQGPSLKHPFGTDQLGRDSLSRMITGARTVLLIGVGSALLALLVGLPIGLVAGFFGSWPDIVLSRIMDAMLAFPGLMLAIAVVAVVGQDLRGIIVAIGVGAFAGFGRIARGETLAIRERPFILAAQTVGASSPRIVAVHILPNLLAPLIVQFSLVVGAAIIAEASLSFLGIGVRPPTPTWGSELQFGFSFLEQHPYLWLIPGSCIFLVTISFNLIGDLLRDGLDPRLRGTR